MPVGFARRWHGAPCAAGLGHPRQGTISACRRRIMVGGIGDVKRRSQPPTTCRCTHGEGVRHHARRRGHLPLSLSRAESRVPPLTGGGHPRRNKAELRQLAAMALAATALVAETIAQHPLPDHTLCPPPLYGTDALGRARVSSARACSANGPAAGHPRTARAAQELSSVQFSSVPSTTDGWSRGGTVGLISSALEVGLRERAA